MANDPDEGIVFIVDDDVRLATNVCTLLEAGGFRVKTFPNPNAFVQAWSKDKPGCLLLDVRFPAANGLDFQAELRADAVGLPVILMTAHPDVHMSIRGLKAGAIDFLLKPFDHVDLFKAVEVAFVRDRDQRARRIERQSLAMRHAGLTKREKQVFTLVVAGLLNKQIADQLDLSLITVKVHRSHMMRKMSASNVPDLVRMHAQLQVQTDKTEYGHLVEEAANSS